MSPLWSKFKCQRPESKLKWTILGFRKKQFKTGKCKFRNLQKIGTKAIGSFLGKPILSTQLCGIPNRHFPNTTPTACSLLMAHLAPCLI